MELAKLGEAGVGEQREGDGAALLGDIARGEGVADDGRGDFEAALPAGLARIAELDGFCGEARGGEQRARPLEKIRPAGGDDDERIFGRGHPCAKRSGYGADLERDTFGIGRQRGAYFFEFAGKHDRNSVGQRGGIAAGIEGGAAHGKWHGLRNF